MPYCPECSKKVSPKAETCPKCGVRIKPAIEAKVRVAGSKSPIVADVLALLPGFFGLWGMGHIYVRKIRRGALLLIGGLIIEILALGTIYTGMIGSSTGTGYVETIAIFAIIALLIALAGWIWQAYDSHRLVKYFNARVEREGKAPW